MRAALHSLAAVLCLFLWLATSARAEPPPLLTIADGTYRAMTPPDWDGKTKLPMVLYLHGYRQSSEEVTADGKLVDAVTDAGVLLIVPDGAHGGWTFANAPGSGRDDVAFLASVIADAKTRFPVDASRIIAAGFSIGGSMVWDLACHDAKGFSAFLPISGDFWTPYPEHCDTGPVNLRHTHGANDTTFPMAGRPLRGGTFHQGAVAKSFEILEQTDACPADADETEQAGDLKCWIWTGCGSGKHIELCMHPGWHEVRPEQLHDGVVWALQFRRGSFRSRRIGD
jgi:polyhydroxybutyrate depolymerase